MKAEEFMDLLGDLDASYIDEAACYPKRFRQRRIWSRAAGIAAAVAVLLTGGFLLQARQESLQLWVRQEPLQYEPTQLLLTDASGNVTVTYAKESELPEKSFSASDVSVSDRILYSAEETFGRTDTVVFYGEVTNIREIKIAWGREKEFGALIEFSVEKVYQGTIRSGDTIRVLVSPHHWIYSACVDHMDDLTVGAKGVFMPFVLDASHEIRYDEETVLAKKDLADYELDDRWMITESEGKVHFSFYNTLRVPLHSMEQVLAFLDNWYAEEK